MDGFGRLGFPHCIGAIDSTHIRIKSRRINEYGNRKYFCSILLQAVTDHRGFFLDAEVGFSGRTHDAFMFVNTNICALMDAGVYVPGNPTVDFNGVRVPALIIADSAFPLRRWLMKPYNVHRTPAQRHFDYNLCRARCVVERAFGRLKARWRRLSVRLDVFFENVNAVVCTCVALHNICENKGHTVLQEIEDQPTFLLPEQEGQLNPRQMCARHRDEGKRVCDAVAEYMFQHRPH